MAAVNHGKFADDGVGSEQRDNALLTLPQGRHNSYKACLDLVTAVANIAGAKQRFAVPEDFALAQLVCPAPNLNASFAFSLRTGK